MAAHHNTHTQNSIKRNTFNQTHYHIILNHYTTNHYHSTSRLTFRHQLIILKRIHKIWQSKSSKQSNINNHQVSHIQTPTIRLHYYSIHNKHSTNLHHSTCRSQFLHILIIQNNKQKNWQSRLLKMSKTSKTTHCCAPHTKIH